MESWVDYYSILQVRAQDERATIESMYKKLCKKYHPDLNPSPDAESRMKDINCAWEVLRDQDKRQVYHREWLRRNAPAPPKAPRHYAAPPPRPQPPPKPPRPAPPDPARTVLAQYFLGIADGRYEDVYELLCRQDKTNIPYDSFLRWQTSVAASYHIESFHILSSKRYDDFPLGDGTTCVAERITLEITEKNLREEQTATYRLVKFVVQENDVWHVYLGYRDVEFIVEQFSLLSGMAAEHFKRGTDMATGLPNRIGFLEKCRAEAYRFERYTRLCTMGIARIVPERSTLEQEVLRRIEVQAGFSLRATVRLIDLVGILGEGYYAVLLSETGEREARMAARRISRRVEQDILVCFDSQVKLLWQLRSYAGGDMGELLALLEQQIGKKTAAI